MKTRVDALLRAQAAAFSFRFACEDCAHFNATAERCSLAYPAAPRRAALDATAATDAGGADGAPTLVLCKTFELG
jgi:hypothetical protein